MKPKVQEAVDHVITNFPELWQSNYQPLLVLLTEHCGIKMADEVNHVTKEEPVKRIFATITSTIDTDNSSNTVLLLLNYT